MQDVKIQIAFILTFKFPDLVALQKWEHTCSCGLSIFFEREGEKNKLPNLLYADDFFYLPHSHWYQYHTIMDFH